MEVDNELNGQQKRIEPQAKVSRSENIENVGHVVFEICEWTDILAH